MSCPRGHSKDNASVTSKTSNESKTKGKYSITIVGSMIHHTVPYGVCEINKDGELIGISEKPEYDYLINTGFYMMNPEVLDLIPDDSHTDMTSVIEMLKNNTPKQWINYRNL